MADSNQANAATTVNNLRLGPPMAGQRAMVNEVADNVFKDNPAARPEIIVATVPNLSVQAFATKIKGKYTILINPDEWVALKEHNVDPRGVIAHELGHIKNHDPDTIAEAQKKGTLTLAALKNMEARADRVAVDAGYGGELRNYFRIMREFAHRDKPDSAHPNLDKRIKNVAAETRRHNASSHH